MRKSILAVVAAWVLLACTSWAQTPTNTFTMHLAGPQAQLVSDKLAAIGSGGIASGTDPCTSQGCPTTGTWMFSWKVSGNVTALGIQVKNNPGAGDICARSGFKHPVTTTAGFNPQVPPSATNVCGTRWLDTNGPGLTVFANIQGGSNAVVDVTVTYPCKPDAAAPGGYRCTEPAL